MPAVCLGGAIAVGFSSVISPTRALALALFVAFVIVCLRSLSGGVAMFMLLAFAPEAPHVPPSAVKLAGAVLALLWVLTVLNRAKPAPFLPREHPVVGGAAILFVMLALASSLWAEAAGVAVSNAVRLGLSVVLVFIVFSAAAGRKQLITIVWGFIAASLLYALLSMIVSGAGLGPYIDTSRLGTSVGDPNDLAADLVPSIFFAAFLIPVVKNPLQRWLLGCSILISSIALLMTGSRGGVAALVVALLAMVALAGPLRARAIVVTAIAFSLGACYFAFVSSLAALGRITQFSAGGGAGRTDLWSIALQMWHAHPLLGVGAGNFQIIEPRYALGDINLTFVQYVLDTPKVAHNTYLHILTELGVVGFAAFAVVVFGSVFLGWQAVRAFERRGDRDMEIFARGAVIGLLGYLGAAFFFSGQYLKPIWILTGLTVALATVARSEAARVPVGAGWAGLPAEPEYDLSVREQLVEQLERRVTERMDALLAEAERLSRKRANLVIQENELRARLRTLETSGAAGGAAAAGPDLGGREERLRELERELDAREAELARRSESAPDAGVSDPAVEQRLAERVEAVAAREHALARRAGALAVKERELREREEALARREAERAATSPAVEPPPIPAPVPTPAAAPPPEPVSVRPAEPEAAPAQAPPPALAVVPAETGPAPWNLQVLSHRVEERAAEFPEREPEWRSYLFFLRDYAEPDGSLPANFDSLIEDVFADILG